MAFVRCSKTWLTERFNLPCELVEAALAHVLEDKTEAATNGIV